MFSSIATRYDVTNEVMSLGVHRLWRGAAVRLSGAKEGDRVLDCATGTGDLGGLRVPAPHGGSLPLRRAIRGTHGSGRSLPGTGSPSADVWDILRLCRNGPLTRGARS
ncbi:class I SAM-dependent methyltransferase [Hyalangium sp.]|uniref:class I SAM-dependent methyltransferase n=1 Tax=Hyalangium sp. TaxID=2028555 RepID=UPI002D70A0BA|nr:class I SAM-dependent methyltransferase [Hyalangium sp.]HYH94811.1 class I SAM-dependent methyltransferase [Hyalangium sp.]